MFALVDCNNFYASCERVFNPKLKNKAIVVLSNNDGCIIARSNEAKALQIKMGDPIFLYKKLIKEKRIEIFSSNFSLYGDMSNRVMLTLKTFGYDMEVYSIDEAFIKLKKNDALLSTGIEIKEKIYRWTGLPVSVGIGPTKTLAKLANELAKKEKGVVVLNEFDDSILEKIGVEDIWGIGSSSFQKLKSINIVNAKQLKNAPDELIKKKLKTPGFRTVLELRGTQYFSLEEIPQERKSILCSRSFRSPLSSFDDLYQKVASFISLGAEKLRKEKKLARYITVFIRTSPFLKEMYANSYTETLYNASDYTPLLLRSAKNALHKIYVKDLLYKKAGILFTNLEEASSLQLDFFELDEEKKQKAIKTLDAINKRYDKKALFFASEGVEKTIAPTKRSCKYTTDWNELLKVT